MPDGSATAHLYRPKLATTLREGYGSGDFRADALAGLTVAIVALPLSMAIAVASGVSPERGLYTSIVGGFVVSALGGSRFQIGGPAGAFIVLVAATTAKFGLSGLLLTVLVSGVLLTLVGLLRLGSLIRHIPHAVTVGFTAGIAVTGTIARTATNIRAGAHSPIAGILHAAFLLFFILVAAPLASYVPLAALAGVLLVVCWNMTEKHEFWRLLGNGARPWF